MATEFVRIPPDSTGKRIRHLDRYDVILTSVLIDLSIIEVGDVVTGVSSGITAKYTGTATEFGETYIHITDASGEFTVGELLSVPVHGNIGTVSSLLNIYTPTVTMVDADNPYHTQKISKEGSSFVRYSEGDLGFDAFGNAQFSQLTKVDEHLFTYGDKTGSFYDDAIIGATVSASLQDSSVVFTTNTTSGSRITRTSHQYYPYNPGEGNETLLSFRLGDESKADVVRRWGLFDDLNGLFFEMSGSTFSTVIRSNTSGTPVDTKVERGDFNGDGLDTVGFSEYILQFSKYNIYWIDYQWLGVGKVRFGTFAPNGKRITMHTFQNPNTYTKPYMRTGTLPIRLEQFNTGVPASISQMFWVCASIMRQNAILDYAGEIYSAHSSTAQISGSASYIPLIAARAELLKNGQPNRSTFVPTDLEFWVDGDPIEVHIDINPNLFGATFTTVGASGSAFIFDDDATATSGSTLSDRLYIGTGVSTREINQPLAKSLKLSADGVSQPIWGISAKCLKSTHNADVQVLVRWQEVI